MRIGLVIDGSLDTLTGGYLYDRLMAHGLARLGHEVEVVSLPGGPYLRRLGRALSLRSGRRLLAGNFDVLLQDELCHPALFLVNHWLRQQAGPPLVAIVHQVLCDEPRQRWRNRLLGLAEKRYLDSVDGFIFNSETTRRTVEAMVGHGQPQVIAYPAGDRFGQPLSLAAIAERANRPGPLELLFLGNVIPRKGLLPLISALAGIDRSLWRLTVVGGLDFAPGYADQARQLINHLGLTNSIRFLGARQGDDLLGVLGASQVFCMPYAYEGFGIAILEAMAFGLPAIGSLAGAAGETIVQGQNGFLLAPEDREGLGALLRRLHQDRDALWHLALAARETYTRRPGWEDGAAAIAGFLQGLTKGMRRLETRGATRRRGSEMSAEAYAEG